MVWAGAARASESRRESEARRMFVSLWNEVVVGPGFGVVSLHFTTRWWASSRFFPVVPPTIGGKILIYIDLSRNRNAKSSF
jgi:hypothetical protein